MLAYEHGEVFPPHAAPVVDHFEAVEAIVFQLDFDSKRNREKPG